MIILCLIKDLLDKNEILELQSTYKLALSLYGQLFNGLKPKERYQMLRPIKLAALSFRKAKTIGFKTTSYMWTNCLNNYSRNKGFIDIL